MLDELVPQRLFSAWDNNHVALKKQDDLFLQRSIIKLDHLYGFRISPTSSQTTSRVCVSELYTRISDKLHAAPTIVVADYPRISRVPLTFFGEGCNTVTGTWRGVGMGGGSWTCSFTGNRDNFDSRFEGNSSKCCIE